MISSMMLAIWIAVLTGMYLAIMVGYISYKYWARKDMELVDDGVDELAELEEAYKELEKQINARYGDNSDAGREK